MSKSTLNIVYFVHYKVFYQTINLLNNFKRKIICKKIIQL